MGDLTPPILMDRGDGVHLAARLRAGASAKPILVFLPGYGSDMQGSKALALDAWAAEQGYGLLRLDYSGCGESQGRFAEGTLAQWRDDARYVIDHLAPGPLVLIGSSMGGWIALLLACALGHRVKGLIGIAAAPDFTSWGFTDSEKAEIVQTGHLLRPSDYGPEPMLTTHAFWQSGQDLRLLETPILIDCPVRLLQGQMDPDVPWDLALRISAQLRSADVQLHFIKDGDHRLSRDTDITLLTDVTARLMETL